MTRVEDWTEDLRQAATEFTAGVAKGMDTPGHLVEALQYDEETEWTEPYSIGATMDQQIGYTGSDDWVYDAGRAVGGGAPLVGFLGTANPIMLAPYAFTGGVDTGRYLYDKAKGAYSGAVGGDA